MYQQWGNVAFICRRATALFLPNPNFARTQHPQQYDVASQPNPMALAPVATQRVTPPLLPLAPAAMPHLADDRPQIPTTPHNHHQLNFAMAQHPQLGVPTPKNVFSKLFQWVQNL